MRKLLLVLFLFACTTTAPQMATRERDVNAALDEFHHAASKADETTYFERLAPHGVFLGTDATERWDKDAFRAYAHPYFSQGKGWTFTPRDRHIAFSERGDVAWFDELLDSASYGVCRGSGVLQWRDGGWKVEQYNLSIPIPNDLAKEFVERIRAK